MIFTLFAPFIFSTSILRPLHTLRDSTHSYCLCTLLRPLHILTASTHSYDLYTLLRPLHTLTASTRSYGLYTISTHSYHLYKLLRPLHCYKTECWIPLHSMDVSGLKSSWHGKCFLLLERVNTCSRMDSSKYNGKLHWKSLHKQEFSIDYPSPRWSFPMIPPKKVFFHWCSLH